MADDPAALAEFTAITQASAAEAAAALAAAGGNVPAAVNAFYAGGGASAGAHAGSGQPAGECVLCVYARARVCVCVERAGPWRLAGGSAGKT